MPKKLSAFLLVLLTVILLALFTMPAPAPLLAQDSANWSGKKVYFSDAFGESSRFDRSETGVSRFAGMLRLRGADVFTLEWRRGIPDDADLVIVPAPTGGFASDAEARLWTYLAEGGHVLLFVEPVDSRGRTSRDLADSGGFFSLTWSDLGIEALSQVVVTEGEMRPVEVTETDEVGNVVNTTTVQSPELSLDLTTAHVDPGHPITDGLVPAAVSETPEAGVAENPMQQLYFNGARPIQIDPSLQDYIAPLISDTDTKVYAESDYDGYVASGGIVEYNIGRDGTRGDVILAGAVESPETGGRLVLVGDVDFITNGGGFLSSPPYSLGYLYPGNVQFMINAINWLLDAQVAVPAYPSPAPTGTPTITPSPVPTATPNLTATAEAPAA